MAPELYPDMVPFWNLFQLLHETRQVGPSGPQPISIRDIEAAASMRGFYKTDDLDFILLAVPTLDRKYLDHHYEEMEKKRKSETKKKNRTSR